MPQKTESTTQIRDKVTSEMLVSFSVENFRSFHTEATLSLIASNRLAGEHGNHAVAVSGTPAKVLRTAVIYGANGAGKSNLFKSLDYLRSLALPFYGRDRESTGREAFRFGGKQDDPSSFDLQFIAKGKVFRYVIKVDDRQVLEEWLAEGADNRERALFERGRERDVVLGSYVKEYPRLAALATVGAPPTQSFLSTVAAAALPDGDIGPDLTSVIGWFATVLNLVPPGRSQISLWRKLNDDPTLLDFASDFLRSSSTGVDRLEIIRSEISREELPNFVGEQQAGRLVEEAESGRHRFIRALRVAGDAWIEVDGSGGFRLVRFQSTHKTQGDKAVNLDLEDESDGTRRLLDLLPALHQMQSQGGVYFVDEIDRSMHPILVRRLLEFFLASCGANPGQMILTTHESSLLDLDLLRRDEVWFAEKDHEQATRLYSLADFKVRNDLEIRKHYLQGRFGAIPFLGSLDRLMKGKEEPV
jgi:AAA15 family ATPase/GTPase